jgi:hypothetical protein
MVPVGLAVLPPVTTSAYPPYDGGVVAAMGYAFREEELIASDIPWAVAWYGEQPAVWLPYDRNDFFAINDPICPIAGIYITQATPMSQTVVETWSGQQQFWTRVFQPPPLWQPPDPSFPLQQWRPMTPDGLQILLSNRPR